MTIYNKRIENGIYIGTIRPVKHRGGYKVWFELRDNKACLCTHDGVQARFDSLEMAKSVFPKVLWR